MANSARVSVGGMLLVASRSRAAPALLVLLATSPVIGQSAEERPVSMLAEAIATAEFVQRVCHLKPRETRIEELTAQANVSRRELEPGGRYEALMIGFREQVRTRLASSLKAMGRNDFCEYAWHAFGAYGARFVRRPR